MTPLHNENTNTSPQGTARSRQHSTNSLFAKATSSPSRKALYNIDGTYKTSGKNSSPHGGAAGASEWHLRSPSSRSGPLAPLGAIANAQATYRQPAQNKVLLATPSSHSILQGPGSKADGLRLHWDDVATSNARQRATSQSQSSSARNSFEQNSQSRHQFASLTARDLSIPDLQDADVVGPWHFQHWVILNFLAQLTILANSLVAIGFALPFVTIHDVGAQFQ